jgi:hypothetical protein
MDKPHGAVDPAGVEATQELLTFSALRHKDASEVGVFTDLANASCLHGPGNAS